MNIVIAVLGVGLAVALISVLVIVCAGWRVRHIMTRKLLLSTRIRRRLKRCKQCDGKGWYWFKSNYSKPEKMACMNSDCSDWVVVLKEVRKLERQLKCLEPKKRIRLFDF